MARALFAFGLALLLRPIHLPAESSDWREAYQAALQSENCSEQIDHLLRAIRQRGEPGFIASAGAYPFESYFPFISLAEAYEDCNELDLAHRMVLIAISRGGHLVPRLNVPGNLGDRERKRWEYQVSRSRERRIGTLRTRLQRKRNSLPLDPTGKKGSESGTEMQPPQAESPKQGNLPLDPTKPKEPIPTATVAPLPIKGPNSDSQVPIELPALEPQDRPVPRPELGMGPTASLQVGSQLRITCAAPCKFLPEEGAVEVGAATWLLPRGYHLVWIDGQKQTFPRRRDLSYDRDLRAMEALMTANLEDQLRLSFGHRDGSSEEHRLALKAIPTAWATGALMFPTTDQAELYSVARFSRIQEIAALKTSDLTLLKARLLAELAGLERLSDLH